MDEKQILHIFTISFKTKNQPTLDAFLVKISFQFDFSYVTEEKERNVICIQRTNEKYMVHRSIT